MRKFKIKVNSREYIVEVEEIRSEENPNQPTAQDSQPKVQNQHKVDKQVLQQNMPSGSNNVLKAPMAGNIVKVNCKPGDKVSPGQLLLVLEAMKMENEITATKSGTIKNVLVTKGVVVKSKQPLLELED